MSTTIADEMKVSIAPQLLQKPELKEAVIAASKQYKKLIDKYNLYPADRELELVWGCDGPDGPQDYVILIARESDEVGQRIAQRLISPKRLLDPVARNAVVSDVYMDILGDRWKQANKRIIAGIRELEAEELKHAESH
jgi:hypothetical protein